MMQWRFIWVSTAIVIDRECPNEATAREYYNCHLEQHKEEGGQGLLLKLGGDPTSHYVDALGCKRSLWLIVDAYGIKEAVDFLALVK